MSIENPELPAQENQEHQEQSEKLESLNETPVEIPQAKNPEDTAAKAERQQADAARLAELKQEILGVSPDAKKETGLDIDPSLKSKGTEFTDALRRVHGRLETIDKESANVVSSGMLGRFRSATRNLEDTFSGSKLDLNETSNSLNRLTGAFEDLSLINDRELRKITEDAKRSLIGAIADSKDSAISLRSAESMAQLSRNINKLISKADEAAFRLRRGLR